MGNGGDPGRTFGLWAIFWSFGGSPVSPEVAEKTKNYFVAQSSQKHHFSRIYDGGRQKLPSQSFEDKFFHFLDIWPWSSINVTEC